MVFISNAQDLAPLEFEQKLSYTEFEIDYYLINQDELNRISLADKVKLKELKSEKEYDAFINGNNDRTTIITHISSEGTYEEWMEEPEVVLIDKDGVGLHSYDGKMIKRIEHSPHYLDMAKNLGSDLLPIFTIPTRDEKLQMQEAGFDVVELDNNTISIRFF